MMKALLAVLAVHYAASSMLAAASTKAPVILVPGLAGSVLEVKLNRTDTPYWDCSKQSEWQVLWLSLQSASRPYCLLDEMQIYYDSKTGKYSNQTGVEIRPLDWGGVNGLVALAPDLPQLTGMYDRMIKGFKDEGYKVGQNLFGAPYDFRLAADGLEQVGFFSNLTRLVEGAVQQNNGAPVVFVSHSMGCLVTLYFLQSKTPEWRREHVAAQLAMSGPWEGSVKALMGSISGDPFDISLLPHDFFRPVQSAAPSGPWLFPRAAIWGDKVLVRTSGGDNYTAGDALRLLDDLNLTQQAQEWPIVRDLIHPLAQQNVDFDLHCIYGDGQGNQTDESYVYDVDHFNGKPQPKPSEVTQGPGDGTVNLASLEACRRLGESVAVKQIANASHTGILADDKAIAYIIELTRKHSPKPSVSARIYKQLTKLSRLLHPRRKLLAVP